MKTQFGNNEFYIILKKMLKYYSKFARLNQADIKNLLIYYDFEKLRQREKY